MRLVCFLLGHITAVDPIFAASSRKWNTTLKSIIPLPEKGDERTYPDYDFPPGSLVLACYPETTSFYRATVESGPHTLTFGTGKVRTENALVVTCRASPDFACRTSRRRGFRRPTD